MFLNRTRRDSVFFALILLWGFFKKNSCWMRRQPLLWQHLRRLRHVLPSADADSVLRFYTGSAKQGEKLYQRRIRLICRSSDTCLEAFAKYPSLGAWPDPSIHSFIHNILYIYSPRKSESQEKILEETNMHLALKVLHFRFSGCSVAQDPIWAIARRKCTYN